MSRTYPAIEIRFLPRAETAAGLRDRLLAGLDDFSPAAIEEAGATWRVFFDSPAHRDAALAHLVAGGDRRVTVEPIDVDDGDWAARSQAELQPIRAGRLVVTPPWAAEDARAQATLDNHLVIVVTPSMGFGTGHHASTRLCLTLLQEIALAGRSVVDIGTGSGVLAIAAARLDAGPVVALDNDPDAIDAARENTRVNECGAAVSLVLGDFRQSPPSPADIVLANLTGDMLRRAAADIGRLTKDGGDCIVSGVVTDEEDGVVTAFDSAGLGHVKTTGEDEWVGIRFRKRG